MMSVMAYAWMKRMGERRREWNEGKVNGERKREAEGKTHDTGGLPTFFLAPSGGRIALEKGIIR